MVNQSELTNSSVLSHGESWRTSHYTFLLFGILTDIIVAFIVTRIIMFIVKNNIIDDYIKMHYNTPEVSVVNITTLESAENIIKKTDESLLLAIRVPPNEKICQTEKLHPKIKRIPLEFDKPENLQKQVTGLPPTDKLRHAEKLRQFPKTSSFEEIKKIEALSQAVCKTLSRKETRKTEKWSLTAARLQQKGKINKTNEPCSTELRIHEKRKPKELNLMPESKRTKEMTINVSTCNVPPNNKTNQAAELKGMTIDQPYNEHEIKKTDQPLLSAKREAKKTKKNDDDTTNEGQLRTKQKNMKLVDVESLSSEDYSALGVKEGIIPVPKNEYQRKLIAIAMRYKIKEIQEKKLKEIEERKLRQKAAKLEAETKIAVDLRTLSSDRKGSVGGGQMESASFEEIRRESVTETETPAAPDAEEKKKEVGSHTSISQRIAELQQALNETAKSRKASDDDSKSVLALKDKELIEIYGNLTEEDLVFEASTVVLPECAKSEDEEIIDRLEPIRRRWKLPRIDGMPSTEETQTFSTGEPLIRSPWDPSYRVMTLCEPLMKDKPTESLSSGTVKRTIPKILLKINKKEDEISSLLTAEEQEKTVSKEEILDDDESQTKPSTSQSTNHKVKRDRKAEDNELEVDPTSDNLSTIDTVPSVEPEIVDLRTASPLYRLNISKNRRRLRGIQTKVRQLGERTKEMTAEDDHKESKAEEPETQVSSVSISSGHSAGSEVTGVSLLQPQEKTQSSSIAPDRSKSQAVNSSDTTPEVPTDPEVEATASQTSHGSEHTSRSQTAPQDEEESYREPGKFTIAQKPSEDPNKELLEILKSRQDNLEQEEKVKIKEGTDTKLSVSRSSFDYAERIEIITTPENKDRPYLKQITHTPQKKREKIIRESTPIQVLLSEQSLNVMDKTQHNPYTRNEDYERIPMNCDMIEEKSESRTSDEVEYL